MGKQKPPAKVQNRAAYSRMSYLYQAASYLSPRKGQTPSEDAVSKDDIPARKNMARQLVSEMRGVALKTQVRIDPRIKQTVCKYCDALLIEGQTCRSVVENKSKHGKKPWADILVIKCEACGGQKRFPVSASRQKRRPLRQNEERAHRAKEGKLEVGDESKSGSKTALGLKVKGQTTMPRPTQEGEG